jgi:hypothetical protein
MRIIDINGKALEVKNGDVLVSVSKRPCTLYINDVVPIAHYGIRKKITPRIIHAVIVGIKTPDKLINSNKFDPVFHTPVNEYGDPDKIKYSDISYFYGQFYFDRNDSIDVVPGGDNNIQSGRVVAKDYDNDANSLIRMMFSSRRFGL